MGGFQVFAEPVTVPLGPLTLLYGPNSAGKSAILDAMLALADLCELLTPDKPKLAADRRNAGKILERHWRREGVMHASPAQALQLGAVTRISGHDWAKAGFAKNLGRFVSDELGPMYPRFADSFSCLQPLIEGGHVDVEVSFQYTLAKSEPLRVDQEVLVSGEIVCLGIGGSQILKWNGQWAAINLGHPALLSWSTTVDLKWLASRHDDVFEHVGEWFVMWLCYQSNGYFGTNAVDSISDGRLDEASSALDSENYGRARGAETSFISMIDALVHASLKSMRDTLRVPVVPASRAVPKSSDVTFIFDASGTPLSGESIGLRMSGLPEHQEITRAAFATELERCGVGERLEIFGIPVPRSATFPIGLVNRLLGDYLFRASGYFVAAGVHELIAPAGREGLSTNTKDVDRKFLVSLELRDASGRRFNFDEVGSGLGYVLPVLLAISTSEVVFLQQPELHLHPALQAELADALIVAMNDATFGGTDSSGCKQIIAETHSEHLLLRLLRRVRQSADPERSFDPHSLGRESLVVLYVDPKPDGSSTVKHLRVAKDGEFIDRWPKGFFEERWVELFDE